MTETMAIEEDKLNEGRAACKDRGESLPSGDRELPSQSSIALAMEAFMAKVSELEEAIVSYKAALQKDGEALGAARDAIVEADAAASGRF